MELSYVVFTLAFIATKFLFLPCLAWDWKARKVIIFRATKGQPFLDLKWAGEFSPQKNFEFKIQLTKSDLTRTKG